MDTLRPFSDRLEDRMLQTRSVLIAGIDPDLDSLPQTFIETAEKTSATDTDFFSRAISSFYLPTLERIASSIAGIKPNLAFFEQYGLGGLRAYREITTWCRSHQLPIIADAKRGDIGSTASAYAHAFFGPRNFRDRPIEALYADALTINPFLGFDTLEPFISRAKETGSGLFVLVRTSNPGSADLQLIVDQKSSLDISARVASWLAKQSSLLSGSHGISGLGAVVGATHAGELKRIRSLMPDGMFLVPGYGAQGGSPDTISQGTMSGGRGVVVNSSRGIFGSLEQSASIEEALSMITARVQESNRQLAGVRSFS